MDNPEFGQLVKLEAAEIASARVGEDNIALIPYTDKRSIKREATKIVREILKTNKVAK